MYSKIISYDLCTPGRNYDDLYKVIKSYGTWAHITESTWFINADESCVVIRDKLLGHMDANDRLFIGELTGTAAWNNIICNDDYLKRNI